MEEAFESIVVVYFGENGFVPFSSNLFSNKGITLLSILTDILLLK